MDDGNFYFSKVATNWQSPQYILMLPNRSSDHSPKVISPFAESEMTVSAKKRFGSLSAALGLGGLVLFAVVAGVIFGIRFLDDPYRTLEIFPVAKYFDNYQSLAGAKFKVVFRVEADLGWKDGTGRLMLFSTEDDPRPLAVLIPPTMANSAYFTKGQAYLAEIEVKEGGLIYADSCQKN